MWRQVPDDGGEEADDADGDQEAGPTIPVLSGRHAGEQNLPEDGQEVHDVIVTRRESLLTAFLIVVAVTWSGRLDFHHLWCHHLPGECQM